MAYVATCKLYYAADGMVEALAVVIKIPPEAMVPCLIAFGSLAVLMFAGAALKDWKARKPGSALKTGMVVASLITVYVIYQAVRIIPAKYIDHGAPGQLTIGFLDGPILGFCALIASSFWAFANQPWPARLVGVVIGAAMFIKPFVSPLYGWYDDHEHPWHFFDPEHLSFHGPGLVALIAGLVNGVRAREVLPTATVR
jgi:hypothetical protein